MISPRVRNLQGNLPMIRPRRSPLFMPGSNARALEKARNLPADVIILDLEDSVAPDAKGLARDQTAQAIAAKGFGKREILIRTNSLDTPWWIDDVAMAGKARPAANKNKKKKKTKQEEKNKHKQPRTTPGTPHHA